MGLVDTVIQMKQQGMNDSQIVQSLQEQGISPKEISDAINQANIKTTLNELPPEGDMQSSIMDQAPAPTPQQEVPVPAPQQEQTPEQYPQNYQEQYPQETQQYNYDYSQGDYYQQYPQQENMGLGTDTIMELAEQVFEEKSKKIEKEIDNLKYFESTIKPKIEQIDERLRKIEMIIDKLQLEILNKIGSYNQDLQEIKRDMNMMQESFGKMVNPLAKLATEKQTKRTTRKKKK